jgi:hypothetical protein
VAEAGAATGRHGWPADGACANCAAALVGDWCHCCGQRASHHHRSLRHLTAELIEGLTHADGRLWHTMRLLVTRPGQLTRDYLRGRRAAEIPPLRMFLVTLLLVFASGSLIGHIHMGRQLPSTGLAQARHWFSTVVTSSPGLTAWLRTHLTRAADDPGGLVAGMSNWAERFAFLLLPLSALVLRVLFPFRRDLKLYDHLIFTMHSLSFAGLVWVCIMVLAKGVHLRSPSPLLLLLALPVHLFVHMRGVYRTGVMSTLWRMLLLAVCTLGVFAVLLVGLTVVSLSTLTDAPAFDRTGTMVPAPSPACDRDRGRPLSAACPSTTPTPPGSFD